MRKINSLFYFFSVVLIIVIFSCSEDNEDIAGPRITIVHPNENEIIDLKDHDVNIDIIGNEEHGNLCCMDMYVKDELNSKIYEETDYPTDHAFECNEHFKPSGITKLTKLTMYIRFTNSLGNFNEATRVFYVEPE